MMKQCDTAVYTGCTGKHTQLEMQVVSNDPDIFCQIDCAKFDEIMLTTRKILRSQVSSCQCQYQWTIVYPYICTNLLQTIPTYYNGVLSRIILCSCNAIDDELIVYLCINKMI